MCMPSKGQSIEQFPSTDIEVAYKRQQLTKNKKTDYLLNNVKISWGFCFFVPFENVSSISRRQQCRLFVDARGFNNCFVFFNSFSTIKKDKTYLYLQTKEQKCFFLFYEKTFVTTELLLPWLEVFFHHLKKKCI